MNADRRRPRARCALPLTGACNGFSNRFFFFLSAILVFAALRVITARNPVYAALHLMLAFFTTGGLWLMLQAEFLAIALIVVYVGAVMVLFLFVVMMLDINIDRIREGFWNYLPLGAVLGLLMVLEMGLVLGSKYFQVPIAEATVPAGVSNTKEIGALLVTDYVYPLRTGCRDPAGRHDRRRGTDLPRPQGIEDLESEPRRYSSRPRIACASCRCL
jgi:NADH-quinone oxidoreductase subunit J